MAEELRIGVIVGSLRAGSYSRRVANALMERAPENWVCEPIEIGTLPLYNEDLDADPPQSWVRFQDAVRASDALLFVTPEYNRSVPGVLKNATDIGSRPAGNNAFAGKPAAVVSVSPYAGGGMAANHALRQSFVYLDLAVMQQPEAYIRKADKLVDAHGKVAGPDADAMLSRFMQAFAAWVARVGTAAAVPFDQFLRQREDASLAYINGDPEPVIALSTRTDPASFFPPSGDRVIRAKAVDAANRKGGKLSPRAAPAGSRYSPPAPGGISPTGPASSMPTRGCRARTRRCRCSFAPPRSFATKAANGNWCIAMPTSSRTSSNRHKPGGADKPAGRTDQRQIDS